MHPDSVQPIEELLQRWVSIMQALVGSIGALAFAIAFLWKIIATDPHSIMQARQWLQRIVLGTVGVEMAGTFIKVLTGTLGR
jgi:hypothetical protein